MLDIGDAPEQPTTWKTALAEELRTAEAKPNQTPMAMHLDLHVTQSPPATTEMILENTSSSSQSSEESPDEVADAVADETS